VWRCVPRKTIDIYVGDSSSSMSLILAAGTRLLLTGMEDITGKEDEEEMGDSSTAMPLQTIGGKGLASMG
jgi:hypothetical protein